MDALQEARELGAASRSCPDAAVVEEVYSDRLGICKDYIDDSSWVDFGRLWADPAKNTVKEFGPLIFAFR